MYSARALIAAFVLATLANGIAVKSPDQFTQWSSGGGAQTVTWQAVQTDPGSFEIQLVNQQGFLSSGPVTLSTSTNTGPANQQNSATVNYPSGAWPTGHGFQINLMSTEQNNNAILAQSGQFNITAGGSSNNAAASSSGTPPVTLTNGVTNGAVAKPSETVVTSLPANYTGNAASGGIGIPNAVSTSGAASASFGQPGPVVSILISVAGLFGVMI